MSYGSRGPIFSARRRRPIGRWILLGIAAVVVLCGIYAALDNGRIVVSTQRVLVSNLPDALEGFTVLHISDLHGKRFGPSQKQIAAALKDRRYSAVCITGDMTSETGDHHAFLELLGALDPTKPVYFIAGDGDPSPLSGQATQLAVMAEWVASAQARGAVYLGAPASLTVNGSTVWFSDAAQLLSDLEGAQAAYSASSSPASIYGAKVVEETVAARKQMRDENLHIALSHKPLSDALVEMMQRIPGEGGASVVRMVDLVLAGSTVGGQWRLPVLGAVWSQGQWFPRSDVMVKGYHYTGGGALLQYISAGLGTDGQNPLPDFRLFNTPEMTLITFTAMMDQDVLPDE